MFPENKDSEKMIYDHTPTDLYITGSGGNEAMLQNFRKRSFTTYTLRGRFCALFVVTGVVVFLLITYNKSGFLKNDVSPGRDFSDLGSLPMGVPQAREDVEQFAIVFDAGSTGSRVHVYRFKVPLSKGRRMELKDEVFIQVKPGLSSYSDDPEKAAQSLVTMLDRCLEEVPHSMYNSTPMILKATAGLRQLPEGVADNILNSVTELLRTYPFLMEENGVDIMDGIDEGIYSWITVNSLLDLQDAGDEKVVTLDLGGGSTQITFDPWDKETILNAADYLKNSTVFQKKYQLYTHSYSGLGLMSARFSLMGGSVNNNSPTLTSHCLPSGQSTEWKYNNQNFLVSGPTDSNMDSCQESARTLVQSQVKPIPELSRRTLYIFSYFFDMAVDVGLLDANEGGSLVVEDYYTAAMKVFKGQTKQDLFLGMDLMYMYTLLHDGYRLPDSAKLYLKKQINHVEMSWTLGAAYQLMSAMNIAR